MAELKIKVRIGQNEFEAEGAKDEVEKHFEAFKGLVSQPRTALPNAAPASSGNIPIDDQSKLALPFSKVFQQEGRFISLVGRPSGDNREMDAALLILLGHKEFRGVDAVTADELLYGLKHTGYNLARTDRVMLQAEGQGLITRNGIRRGKKYRLTIPGITRAMNVGQEIQDLFQVS